MQRIVACFIIAVSLQNAKGCDVSSLSVYMPMDPWVKLPGRRPWNLNAIVALKQEGSRRMFCS
eukprot:7477445-Pyramimonas_sp.AAC.1